MQNPQLLLISRNLVETDEPVTTGHILVRCHDNLWRFIDPANPRRQQRGKVVQSDFTHLTLRIIESKY